MQDRASVAAATKFPQVEVLVDTSGQFRAFLDARRQAAPDSETVQNARRALLACDKAEVLALFERHLQVPDDEERASTIHTLASLYGREATDTILRWINDPSPIVRSVACSSLREDGAGRVVAALVDRLNGDTDGQIRQIAANALGHMVAIEALPELHHAWVTDLEDDELGYTASGAAEDAITSIMRDWALRQIQGTPPRTFRESTRSGHLTGAVIAESIPVAADGRIQHRYTHLPLSSFGPGCALKNDVQTSLVDPFEIEVEYADPTCVIQRTLIYQRISNWVDFNWSVTTILDPAVTKSPPKA